MCFAEGVLLEGSRSVVWVLLSRAEGWVRQEQRAQCGTALLLHCQVALGLEGQVNINAKMCFVSSELPGSYFHAACAK